MVDHAERAGVGGRRFRHDNIPLLQLGNIHAPGPTEHRSFAANPSRDRLK